MQQVYIATNYPQYDHYVEFVQLQLNKIRNSLLHNLPAIRVDGKYGFETANAVKVFQQACNIRADGVLGSQTRMCLAQKMRELPGISAKGPSFSEEKLSPYEIYEFVANKVIKNIADTLSDISDLVCKQVEMLNEKKNITLSDIDKIVNSMIDKPNVKAMRESIKKNIWDELEKKAKWNTNVVNYKKDRRTISRMSEIGEAQRQVKKGMLSSQSNAAIRKILSQQIVESSIKEMQSVNFERIITEKVAKTLRIPKAGGILTALSFLPLTTHVCELIYKSYQGLQVKDTVTKIVADIISLLVGIVLTIVLAALVAAIGITGGLAIVIVIALGVIVSILLSILFPDWEKRMADKLIEFFYGIIQSMGTYRPDGLYYQYAWPTSKMI